MGREAKIYKEFSENIDRLLAGEEATLEADTSEDNRAALDFVQKMIELRAVPSASFESSLRERLLSRMSEAEHIESGSIWEVVWSLFRSPVWRAVLPVAVVVVLAVSVLWRAGFPGFQSKAPAPIMAPIAVPSPAPAAPPAITQPAPTIVVPRPTPAPVLTTVPPPVVITQVPHPTIAVPAPVPTPAPAPPPSIVVPAPAPPLSPLAGSSPFIWVGALIVALIVIGVALYWRSRSRNRRA